MSDLAKDLAANLVQLRRVRGWSQADLATLAGLPRSTIAHLETGGGNPTLATVSGLAKALSVSIEELLIPCRPQTALLRAEEVPVHKKVGGAVRVAKLLPDKLRGMELDRMELAAGVRMTGTPHLPHTKEFITVVRGHMAVYVAGEAFELRTGDVLAFPGDRPHSYHNLGRDTAEALSVVVIAHMM
ncbi:MAG: helix-turn-helix transcriptional regulator [Acidobacteria bacterium]|nr:helix-turn-helix transcriptional regulator [Acidobacteriota bacterium]